VYARTFSSSLESFSKGLAHRLHRTLHVGLHDDVETPSPLPPHLAGKGRRGKPSPRVFIKLDFRLLFSLLPSSLPSFLSLTARRGPPRRNLGCPRSPLAPTAAAFWTFLPLSSLMPAPGPPRPGDDGVPHLQSGRFARGLRPLGPLPLSRRDSIRCPAPCGWVGFDSSISETSKIISKALDAVLCRADTGTQDGLAPHSR
jgi:hypothetical protein